MLLGVSGSVATIKLKELVIKLTQIPTEVRIVSTAAARHFFKDDWDLDLPVLGMVSKISRPYFILITSIRKSSLTSARFLVLLQNCFAVMSMRSMIERSQPIVCQF